MILLIKLIPVLIGLLCILLALLPRQQKEIMHPVITEGEIVSAVIQHVQQYGNETELFAPVVKYQTESGVMTGTAKQFIPEWQYQYHTGNKIQICYDQMQPEKFIICHDEKAQFRKIILLTVGIGILTAYAVLNLL